MKKWLLSAAYGGFCLFTACVGVLDLILAGLWWKMFCYVEKFGAEENLRAAEDAGLYGLFAIMLLVPFLCLLAVLLLWRSSRTQKAGERIDENKTAETG